MNKELFNKIKSYLEKQKPVKVEFGPHHKGCDVMICKKDYSSDYDFFDHKYADWWYEDNGLEEMLQDNDAYADTIMVEFKLDPKNITANVTLCFSDNSIFGEWDKHSKSEIITPLVVSTLKKHLNISDDEFNDEVIEFDIEFNDEVFDVFEIYYGYNQKIGLSKVEKETLKKEILSIIKDWTGPFWGINAEYNNCHIIINKGEEVFNCTDVVVYNFKIESEE